jgi:hypothetical protein
MTVAYPNWEHLIRTVEEWVKTSEEGKRWMCGMAAEIGAPVQLTLSFDGDSKDGKHQDSG